MLTVVTGPPAGGKSTYVTNHAGANDIVIDFDVLAIALGSHVDHDHARDVVVIAQAAWQAASKAAQAVRSNVWLIHAQPNAQSLAIYKRLGARLVVIDPGQSVVRERIAQRGSLQAQRFADAWYRS